MFNEFATISTLAEVRAFASYLFFGLGTTFHPDDDFNDYIDKNGSPAFTPLRAARLNQRMSECHGICEANGIDICDHMGISADYFKAISEGMSIDEARNALEIVSDATFKAEPVSYTTYVPESEN